MSENALFLLNRLTYLRRSALKSRFAELDFTMGMYAALRELSERESCPQSELLTLELDRAAVSRLLRKLVDRGFVSASAHENDRRQTLLNITPHGREALLVLEGICEEVDGKLLPDIRPEELAVLESCAVRMLENWRRELRP